MSLDVAVIQAEGELVNVAVQMLLADVMIYADQAALQNREYTLDAVGRYIVANIFSGAVIDGSVFECFSRNTGIDTRVIGIEYRSDFDVLLNFAVDCFFVSFLNRHCNGLAAAFAHRQYRSLADRAASQLQLLVLMLVLFDPSDISLVNLDDPLKLRQIVAARFAKAPKNKPSRLLRDPDFPSPVAWTNALARCDEQIHRVNPLVQWNMRPLEYRAGPYREVLLALVTAVVPASARRDPFAKPAYRARRTLRPEPRLKVNASRLLVREHREQLKGGIVLFDMTKPSLRAKSSPNRRGSQVYNSLC